MVNLKSTTRASSVFTICVDQVDQSEFCGRIFHCLSTAAIPFAGPQKIFLEMEEVFDRIGYPQSSTQSRTFSKNKQLRSPVKEVIANFMSEKDIASQQGDKGTFVVHIQYRQNATWQGKVTWAEKNCTLNFRSALELLKMIDSALDGDGVMNNKLAADTK